MKSSIFQIIITKLKDEGQSLTAVDLLECVLVYFSAYLMRSSAPNPGQKDHGQHNKGAQRREVEERRERREASFWVGLRGVVCTEKSNQLTNGGKKLEKKVNESNFVVETNEKCRIFLHFLYTFL